MVKRKGGKKDILGVEKQLIDLMNKYVCYCGNWKISVGDINPFFPKQFQLSLNGNSVVDPKDGKYFWSSIYISPGESAQEPTFKVLLKKWYEVAELIHNKIDKEIKCLGVCKKC